MSLGSLTGNIPAQQLCGAVPCAIPTAIEHHQLMYKVYENPMCSCIRKSQQWYPESLPKLKEIHKAVETFKFCWFSKNVALVLNGVCMTFTKFLITRRQAINLCRFLMLISWFSFIDLKVWLYTPCWKGGTRNHLLPGDFGGMQHSPGIMSTLSSLYSPE